MATPEKERLYNPSEWSKRYASQELLDYFWKFCAEATEKARKTIKCELNVPYGKTERTKYDIYGTDLPKDAPIFVFVHGGYWQEFSKDLTGFSVPIFVENKIKVITIGYDLCPHVEIWDIVAQIKSAVAQILKYASDSGCKSVWIGGHSAGAHLIASFLYDDNWIKRMTQQGYITLLKGLVLIAGLYDVRPVVDVSQLSELRLTDEVAKTLSWSILDEPKNQPLCNLKVVVTVGGGESPKFIDESRQYAQKLISIVNNVEFLFLPDNDHFDIVENLLDPNYILGKLLVKCIKPDANTK
ncbi:kynurenine formamidase-like isoform X2 [Odontomachus brunneus]|uniref:kynurenine formamidase-like isoform X2 n=1 Tax=Odontomachus brunneus TaxID=486640 RepID=UPI0013F1B284|nr:kynurenine formamidase-like isoform X2 [Odontomachus brunneus]